MWFVNLLLKATLHFGAILDSGAYLEHRIIAGYDYYEHRVDSTQAYATDEEILQIIKGIKDVESDFETKRVKKIIANHLRSDIGAYADVSIDSFAIFLDQTTPLQEQKNLYSLGTHETMHLMDFAFNISLNDAVYIIRHFNRLLKNKSVFLLQIADWRLDSLLYQHFDSTWSRGGHPHETHLELFATVMSSLYYPDKIFENESLTFLKTYLGTLQIINRRMSKIPALRDKKIMNRILQRIIFVGILIANKN